MSRRTTLLLLLALSAGHAQAADLVASVSYAENAVNAAPTLQTQAAAVRPEHLVPI